MYIFRIKYLVSLLILLLFTVGVVLGQFTSSAELSEEELPLRDSVSVERSDSVGRQRRPLLGRNRAGRGGEVQPDSVGSGDSLQGPRVAKSPLEDVMDGTNDDSVYYDVRNSKIYIYNKGKINYQSMSMEADIMEVDMSTNEIFARGVEIDSAGVMSVTKPVFIDGGSTYTMDTITYNMDTEMAKIKGIATQEGDGWLVGDHVKKHDNDHIYIHGGKYTTCDCVEHPHFYLAMTKAKVIPGEKVVTGPAYLVMEDVPIYFLGLPEGFFPLYSGPRSGLIMPSYGEDGTQGFFIRDLGYYFSINDYLDLTLQGGFYSLGSWEASATSRYVKRYKYSGNVNIDYSKVVAGEKYQDDYLAQNTYRIQWTHSQDAKANPGSTFSASVNFTSSGYSKYSATTISDMLSTQTNSSIAYSKTWNKASLTTNMAISQNSQTEAISLTFPSLAFSVSQFYPFKFGDQVGSTKWYEKIAMSYSMKMTNSVTTTESELMTKQTLEDMSNGIQHSIPVSASFNLFKYINLTPSFSYTEKWYFQQFQQQWNAETNTIDTLDPEYGFYRLYNYTTSLSASTTVYGMYQAKGPNNPIRAIRHTITPTVGMSYAPDFSRQKYGYYATVQSDSLGTTKTYSPFTGNAYGVPSSGETMSLNGSLSQTLEMKVRSKRDTSGVRKIKLIEELKLSGSYNFLADSMKLSTIALTFRTTLFNNFGLNLSMTLDPYKVSPEGVRYDKLFFPGRVTSTSWSYGYTFKSRSDKSTPAINDINSLPPEYTNPYYDPDGTMDPVMRRTAMAATYYDFSLPWNLGFNYVISYGVNYLDNGTTGYEPSITQSLGLSGSITFTKKMGLTASSGFDLESRQFTTTSVSITRDLHCWQMSFSWIPFGYYRSWSFNIAVKASSLSDLKYDKSESMYDNLY
ncbi:MAG: putative LPS assembly protein LptD [Rikenellaceae bacterium]